MAEKQDTLTRLFRLDGKTALVTGASSGIGLTMASALADAGAAVVLSARRAELLENATAQIQAAGGKAACVMGDVAEIEQLPELAEKAGGFFGPPDILVNAAGINPRQPWDEISPETWHNTLALNLSAPFFLARQLVPAMQEKGWGKIINIASLQSVRAFPNGAAYGASKGGIMQLTRAMAEAWSANEGGITCNAIAPGFFKTGLTESLFEQDEVIQSLANQTIIGRNGKSQDLHGVTVFLASKASDYITGQTIFLDGGWTAK
ncbi:MAG: SDR family oxidoreductase [Deltaproteobacteria bacterium]|jgi:NAD(P)-dependent dehydrogenase (short-subunit alcohol dehydrogenase family)|nr:SDR family oxidoreductase [Deltaproteobacteria bacterium]MBT4644618.1 SDR family oxidoreductase [Deltaproteobacteria bacterium]MBT6499822.1 SDR family oxidoreductase [Deltaproteobacteria bacterium]MBT6615126.1 SDR family oxidoreductase [Deltaproteobacteria bacterium]MBT7712771.1 SDR family oxidoreductase [Deltaproteobacteria bacterium]